MRLHNVQAEITDGLARRGNIVGRMLSLLEGARIAEFEHRAVTGLMPVWCISQRDADTLRRSYDRADGGVLSVSVDRPDLLAIEETEGDRHTLVHIGSIDLKKKPGFEMLLEGFRQMRRANPTLRLIVAGHHSVSMKGMNGPGVVNHGKVDSDVSIIRQGRFFVNPQNVSGGIKLKSICALLAGRTLISTDEGVEGLDLSPHEDYMPFHDPDGFCRVVQDLLQNEDAALSIAKKGRETAQRMFSEHQVDVQLATLLRGMPATRHTDA
jgi:glycosyltransferase involved in cell wall biosynthesis